MSSPTAPVITATGISAPTYAQILAYLQSQYYAIFGQDAYIDPDSQDGQLLAVFAQAISDANSATIAVYNAFSPATAQGVGLSSVVQINGLTRLVPTNSTCLATLTGTPNATVTNGSCVDPSQNVWTLPTPITFPADGSIAVTATCATAGAISLGANLLSINTPTYGWTGVTNAVAIIGNPAETDAALRLRQGVSTALPSITIFEGIVAAIEQVPGVTRVRGYENNTSAPLALTGGAIPANNLCFIVEGGNDLAIFQAIFSKITPGIPTYRDPNYSNLGSSDLITDSNGSTRLLNFMFPNEITISVTLNAHPLAGWAASTNALIQAALIAYFATLPIGTIISYFNLVNVINLLGTPQTGTFKITALTLQGSAADVTLNYNQAPNATAASIAITNN